MVTFFTPGTPAPQGSKSGFIRGGRVVLVESSKKVKPWREAVSRVAREHCTEIIDGPVTVNIEFMLPRPKSLPKRVKQHVKKPDTDKLIRSTLDALSGIAYVDDNRVNAIHAVKHYCHPDATPGATITIERSIE
jgi:Holliday junction resolvase RusA-like endonuclease